MVPGPLLSPPHGCAVQQHPICHCHCLSLNLSLNLNYSSQQANKRDRPLDRSFALHDALGCEHGPLVVSAGDTQAKYTWPQPARLGGLVGDLFSLDAVPLRVVKLESQRAVDIYRLSRD